MPLIVNLRHLEAQNLRLDGEIPAHELDLEGLDALMQPVSGLRYVLEIERHERGLLLQGCLALTLQCECARCLRTFQQELALSDWVVHLSWEGEEAVPVHNDCVDLTPYLREDIVLALPQRPLCDPECGGLQVGLSANAGEAHETMQADASSPAWAKLNKLKF